MNILLFLNGRTRPGRFAFALACAGIAGSRADIVPSWNAALAQHFQTAGLETPPQAQARAFGLMHLAMAQAFATLHEPKAPVGTAETEAQAAAAIAARDVLARCVPDTGETFAALANVQLQELGAGPRALTVGRDAAIAVLQKRADDGWTESELRAASTALPPTERSATAREPKSPWLEVTPFVLKGAAQFAPTAPYWRDLEGNVFPNGGLMRARIFDAAKRDAAGSAQFWAGSTVVAWNRVARQLIAASGLDTAARARAFATVNLAMADSALAALHWRFAWGQWQSRWTQAYLPVQGMPMATDLTVRVDGLEQTMLVRPESGRVLTAPVPDFPSIAATVAGAASATLTCILGERRAFALPTLVGEPAADGPMRSFADLVTAGHECAFAASLDGRHTREACVAGFGLGEKIGNYAARQSRATR